MLVKKSLPSPISVIKVAHPSATDACYVREDFADGAIRYWLRRQKANRPLTPDECRQQMAKLPPEHFHEFFPAEQTMPDHSKLEVHPFCLLVPEYDHVESVALEESMRRTNLLAKNPITLHEGRILDGRNRYEIAMKLGFDLDETHFVEFTGTDAEARQFVLSRLTHRNLSDRSARPSR